MSCLTLPDRTEREHGGERDRARSAPYHPASGTCPLPSTEPPERLPDRQPRRGTPAARQRPGHQTITLEGDANGAPHPEPNSYAGKLSGKYVHWLITGGIGHNLAQEAPRAFAQAVLDVTAL